MKADPVPARAKIRLNRLSYQILGVIARNPSSGYDVMKTLHLLRPIKISQIYQSLSAMESANLVSAQEVVQHGKPNKRVHELTEHGAQVLGDWIAGPTAPPLRNDAFVAKVFSMWRAPNAERQRLVTARIDWLNGQVERFDAMKSDLHSTAPERHLNPDHWEFSRDILVNRRLLLYREELRWCQHLLATLTAANSSQS